MADIFDVFKNKAKNFDPYNIWEYQPVDIIQFVEDPYYLDLDNQTRHWIKDALSEIFSSDDSINWNYKEVCLCCAIGSGKSFLSSIVACYCAYILLCLKNPQEYFGLSPTASIHIVNVSTNLRQAQKVIFSDIKNMIESSYWFKEHYLPNPRVKSELQFDTTEYDQPEFGKIYKKIFITPLSSDLNSPVGLNVYGGFIDEANLLRDTDRGDYSEIIYNHLQRRITSRFGDKGLIVMCGSPQYLDDFLERKIRSEIDNSNVYVKRISIWEAKYPNYNGDTFYFDVPNCKIVGGKLHDQVIEIPTVYYKDFYSDPEKAKRDLAGIPGETISAFFEDKSVIDACCNYDRESPITETNDFKDWFKFEGDQDFPEDEELRVMHIDIGLTNDSAGICMGHLKGVNKAGEPIISIDFIMELKGSKENPVSLEYIRQLIYYLIFELKFPVIKVTYDSFQSADSVQILNKKGICSEIQSVDRDISAYNILKELIRTKRIDFYSHEKFIKELKCLELIKNSKVDHPSGKDHSKDCSDAVAGVCNTLIDMFVKCQDEIDFKVVDNVGVNKNDSR